MCEKCAETDRKVLGSLNRVHEKLDKQNDRLTVIETELKTLKEGVKETKKEIESHDIILFGAGTDKPGILTVIAKMKTVTDNLSKISVAVGTAVIVGIFMYFFKL